MPRSPLSARLRALANPRVIAIAVLAGAGVLYLRKQQAHAAGSQLQGDTLPVEPSSSVDPFGGTDLSSGVGVGAPEFHDPITLSPGDSVYDPNSGRFITAPSLPDVADTQTTDATGGQTAPAAPGNTIAAKANKRTGGKRKLPKTKTSHLPSSFDPSPIVRKVLGKPAIARATQVAHLGAIGGDRHLPALAHPPSRSAVERVATIVTGAAVHTAPRPAGAKKRNAPPLLKKSFPPLHAGEHRALGPAAAAPVRTAKPVAAKTARGPAVAALVSRPVVSSPATAARRDVVAAVTRAKSVRGGLSD
jgi:hypothetical protein